MLYKIVCYVFKIPKHLLITQNTGIWPESEVFNDKGLGPIPSRWKGHCQSGTIFDPAKACNRKLIGAKYFLKGFEAEAGRPAIKDPDFLKVEFASPRDRNGHGTHTSSTAGGSFAPNASYHGLGYGTVRGGAPKARIAMYKVCWNWLIGGCTFADIMMAIDEAIHDGVDILSLSLGMTTPQYADVDMRSGVAFASFHAVTKGITIVCSGGNEGPIPQTVDDTSPWLLTVAASSIDRSFPTLITLGNNRTFAVSSLTFGKDIILEKKKKTNVIICRVNPCILERRLVLSASDIQKTLNLKIHGMFLISYYKPSTDIQTNQPYFSC